MLHKTAWRDHGLLMIRPGTFLRRATIPPLLKGVFRRGDHVLDVGGFDGAIAAALQKYHGVRCDVFDIDKTGFQAAKAAGVGTHCGSILNSPFESHAFDVVTCIDVLVELPQTNVEKALREMKRITRKGGRVVASFSDANLSIPFRDMLTLYKTWNCSAGFLPDEFLKIASSCGLECVEHSRYYGVIARATYSFFFVAPRMRFPRFARYWLWAVGIQLDRLFCINPQVHVFTFSV